MIPCKFQPDPTDPTRWKCSVCGMTRPVRREGERPPTGSCRGSGIAAANPNEAHEAAEVLGITWDDAKRYAAALRRWQKAGRPRRSDEEVERILAICQSNECGKYDAKSSRCASCRCRVNSGPAITNKIRMATEDCPKSKWKENETCENQKRPRFSPAERRAMQKRRMMTPAQRLASPIESLPTWTEQLRAGGTSSLSAESTTAKSSPLGTPTTSRLATLPLPKPTYLSSSGKSSDAIPPPVPGKIDVVYTLGAESKWQDNEIRYSIRSLEKNFLDLGRIWIVGHRPKWLTGVVHVPMEDAHLHNKDANLLDKVFVACRSGVTEQFVFCSDDQVFLRPIRFAEMRPLHYEDMTDKPNAQWGDGSWWQRLKATRDELKRRGFTAIKNYDSHCPTPYDREKYLAVIPTFDYAPPPGYTINSLYCNAAKVAGEPVGRRKYSAESGENDAAKIRGALKGKTFFGYSDPGLTDALKTVLGEMFPMGSSREADGQQRQTAIKNDAGATQQQLSITIGNGSKMLDTDLLRRIYLAGSDSLKTFGGWYEGAYCLQQVPEEAAEFIALAKNYLRHPRMLEVGSAAGGFAKLLDDELVCRSVRIVDNNMHPKHHLRAVQLPHAIEHIGDAAQCGNWLEDQGERYDLIVQDTDHVYEHEKRHMEVSLPHLEPGGLLVFHDSIACRDVGKLVEEMKAGSHDGIEFVRNIGSKLGLAVFRKKGVSPSLPKYVAPQATLLYHFCPWLKRPEIINFHVRCLARYLHQFTKVRINIVTGDDFASPESIEERLRPFIKTNDVEFFRTPCLPETHGETISFFTKLLPSVGDDENVCYGHTKAAMLSGLPGGLAWGELMYSHVFQNSRAASAHLENHPCVGAFLRSPASRGAKWHYAGTFFWFKNVRRFSGWDQHNYDRYGVEAWLGRFVPQEDAVNVHGRPFQYAVCHNKHGLLDAYGKLPW